MEPEQEKIQPILALRKAIDEAIIQLREAWIGNNGMNGIVLDFRDAPKITCQLIKRHDSEYMFTITNRDNVIVQISLTEEQAKFVSDSTRRISE